ncbi:Clp protease N-terminal domain-containing protein [Streptomyces beigongshangae]|uniref:Clp protease N-terminal domain-containing protein n=1 Tax=Streptomyces beigongshangae TaxID=2841597 RepID=UPI001C852C9A|nr:Clp protease N-terminal domain-containing protein [Streptomyces sp. REN17]
MEAIKEPDWKTVGVLGAARGARATAEDPIGTEHLLAALTTSEGTAREALADEGATKVALLAVLRDREGRDDAWSGDDGVDASVVATDVLGDDGDRRVRFTGGAARALTAAMEHARREGASKFGAVHLLRGLLEGDNRAVETLAVCKVSPQAVRARLDGDAGSPEKEDDLSPLLHATRDALLGRGHYRHMPLWKRWLIKSGGVNWASTPVEWVRQESYEQARRLGDGAAGTEHVLLAVLATHEVALRYPHLAKVEDSAADTRFAGGGRLAGLGLSHASVHGVLTGGRVPLAADARPVEQYFGEMTGPGTIPAAGATAPDAGTGPLVALLLEEETRARQLVDVLTTAPGH